MREEWVTVLLSFYQVLFHDPSLDIPSIIIKVNPDFEQLSGIRFKWSGVMFRFDLLQGFFGRTFQFEFHHVDVTVGLQYEIHPAFGCVISLFHVETYKTENNKKYVLIVYFQIPDQLVRRIGKETLQAT